MKPLNRGLLLVSLLATSTAVMVPLQNLMAQDVSAVAAGKKSNVQDLTRSKQDEMYVLVMDTVSRPKLSQKQFTQIMLNAFTDYSKYMYEILLLNDSGKAAKKAAEDQIVYNWKTYIMNRLNNYSESPLTALLGNLKTRDLAAKVRTLLSYGSNKNSQEKIFRKESDGKYVFSRTVEKTVVNDPLNPLMMILKSKHDPKVVFEVVKELVNKNNIYSYNAPNAEDSKQSFLQDPEDRIKPLSRSFNTADNTAAIFKVVLDKDYDDVFQLLLENYEDLDLKLTKTVLNPHLDREEEQYFSPVLEDILKEMKKFGDVEVTVDEVEYEDKKGNKRNYIESYMSKYADKGKTYFNSDFIHQVEYGALVKTIPNAKTRAKMVRYLKLGRYRNQLLQRLSTTAFNQGEVLDLIRYALNETETQKQMLAFDGDKIIFGNKNSRSWNALMFATFYKSEQEVKLILNKSQSALHNKDAIGNTAVHMAFNLTEDWYKETTKSGEQPMKSLVDFLSYSPEDTDQAIQANLALMKILFDEKNGRKDQDKILALKTKNALGYTPITMAAALGYYETFEYLKDFLDKKNNWDPSEHDFIGRNVNELLAESLERRITDYTKVKKDDIRASKVQMLQKKYLTSKAQEKEMSRTDLIKEVIADLSTVTAIKIPKPKTFTAEELESKLVTHVGSSGMYEDANLVTMYENAESDLHSSSAAMYTNGTSRFAVTGLPPVSSTSSDSKEADEPVVSSSTVSSKSKRPSLLSMVKKEKGKPTVLTKEELYLKKREGIVASSEVLEGYKRRIKLQTKHLLHKSSEIIAKYSIPTHQQYGNSSLPLKAFKTQGHQKTKNARYRDLLLSEVEYSWAKDQLGLLEVVQLLQQRTEEQDRQLSSLKSKYGDVKEKLERGHTTIKSKEEEFATLSEGEQQVLNLIEKSKFYREIATTEEEQKHQFPVYRDTHKEGQDFDKVVDLLVDLAVKNATEAGGESDRATGNHNCTFSKAFEEITDVLIGEDNDMVKRIEGIVDYLSAKGSRSSTTLDRTQIQVLSRFKSSLTNSQLPTFKLASLQLQKPYIKSIVTKLLKKIILNDGADEETAYTVDEMLEYLTTGPDGKIDARPQINKRLFANLAIKQIVQDTIYEFLTENEKLRPDGLTEEQEKYYFKAKLDVSDPRNPEFNLRAMNFGAKYRDKDDSDGDYDSHGSSSAEGSSSGSRSNSGSSSDSDSASENEEEEEEEEEKEVFLDTASLKSQMALFKSKSPVTASANFVSIFSDSGSEVSSSHASSSESESKSKSKTAARFDDTASDFSYYSKYFTLTLPNLPVEEMKKPKSNKSSHAAKKKKKEKSKKADKRRE